MSKPTVGIVGTGPWVEMMVALVEGHGNVVIWPGYFQGRRPKGSTIKALEKAVGKRAHITSDPAELAKDAWLIILALPSWLLRETGRQLGEHLTGHHRLVHLIRGLEPDTGQMASRILSEVTPVRQLGAIAGPIFPSLVLAGKPGGGVIGSRFPALIREVQQALSGSSFRVYGNLDIRGVELAAVSAPLMAVVAGLADAMELGPSVQGTIIARGVAEMTRFAEHYGAEARTISGMAGLGYLIAQTTKPGGNDFQVGRSLVAGTTVKKLEKEYGLHTRELVATSRVLAERAGAAGLTAHIVTAANGIFSESLSVPEAAQGLLGLDQMME